MAIFAILCFLLGAVLGQRLRVLALGPSIAVGMVVAIAIGLIRAEDAWLIVVTAFLVGVCLQIGYLCGAVMESLTIASRTTSIRSRKSLFNKVVSR